IARRQMAQPARGQPVQPGRPAPERLPATLAASIPGQAVQLPQPRRQQSGGGQALQRQGRPHPPRGLAAAQHRLHVAADLLVDRQPPRLRLPPGIERGDVGRPGRVRHLQGAAIGPGLAVQRFPGGVRQRAVEQLVDIDRAAVEGGGHPQLQSAVEGVVAGAAHRGMGAVDVAGDGGAVRVVAQGHRVDIAHGRAQPLERTVQGGAVAGHAAAHARLGHLPGHGGAGTEVDVGLAGDVGQLQGGAVARSGHGPEPAMAWLDGAWTALGLPWPTHKGRGPMSSDPEHATAAAAAADAAPPATVPDLAAPTATPGPTAVGRLLRLLTREPVLVVSLVYALVSIMGMWSYYWFYDRLGVPILEYLQGADLFVIGLRRPDYLLIVLAVLAFMWVSVLPMRWAQRNPERAAELTTRHRWMRWLLFLPSREGKWTGGGWISVETQIALMGLLLSLQYLFVWNLTSASR